jgi:hypothetical protein
MQLYIHRDGQQFGPYPEDQARQFLASGELSAGDLAWHEGAAGWAPLSDVLKPIPAASTPAAASPIPAASPAASPSAAAAAKPRARAASASQGAAPDALKRAQRSAGLRAMGFGALFFLGGSGFTIYSYMSATSNPSGGRYVVTWGAIIFGAIRFGRGLILFLKNR